MRPGHHGNNKGPKLPGQLLRAVQGSGPAPGGSKHGIKKRTGGNRKVARKAARQEKKHRRLASQQQRNKRPAPDEQGGAINHEQPRLQPQLAAKRAASGTHIPVKPHTSFKAAAAVMKPKGQPPSGCAAVQRQPKAGPSPSAQPPARTQPKPQASSKKTRFSELLAPENTSAALGASREAYLADLRAERQMRRLLKLNKRKNKKVSGPEDGLDDLLAGITAGEQLLPSYMQGVSEADVASSEDEGEYSDDVGADDDGSSEDMADELGEGASDEGEDDISDDFGLGDSDDEGEEAEGSDAMDMETDEGEKHGQGFSDEDDDGEDEESEGQEGEEEGTEQGMGESDEEQLFRSSDGGSSGDEEGSEQEEEKEAAAERRAASLGGQAGPSGAAGTAGGRYVPPALRAAAAAGADKAAQLERRLTGLLNRLAEANLQGIVRDVAAMYASEGRRLVAELTAKLLLQAVSEGPRASEQFAAITATFVAGLSAEARAQDIAARFLEQTAAKLEEVYASKDSLAQHNLMMVMAYCYSCGLLAADLMFSILDELRRRFAEADVSMMVTLLNAVGLQLRSDDPAAMKDFVVAVHERAAQASGAQGSGMSKRAQLMLELVVDIKNNRPRSAVKAAAAAAAGGGAAARKGGAAAVVEPGTLKWLRNAGVADVQLVNLSWAKLLLPNKKGMWWLPAATDAAQGLLPGGMPAGLLPDTPAGGTLADASAGGIAQNLLGLAAAQRMNTDVRRAVFVAIMGSEDCVEAFEKLTRLPLKGEQDREIMRVVLDCCLQERAPNPYYSLLAAKLAQHDKGQRVTLQYSLWDKLKELPSMDARQLTNLSHFMAALVALQALPLAVVKSVNFTAATSTKELFFWRVFFTELLLRSSQPASSSASRAAAPTSTPFAKLAAQPSLGAGAKGIATFLRTCVAPWLASPAAATVLEGRSGRGAADVNVLLARLKAAERTLASSVSAMLA